MVALDCLLNNGAVTEYEFDRTRQAIRAARQFANHGEIKAAKIFMGKCCVAELRDGKLFISDALKVRASDSRRVARLPFQSTRPLGSQEYTISVLAGISISLNLQFPSP